ncbi:hypothetical protein [Salinisphaera sp. T31B1]|uniref:hypothetical protein n=1 Tax=Salinisphaera sp. T31B1 TaxID=727963 RepID=UPI003342BD38
MTDWQLEQLTEGSAERRFHAHSYYDIRVFDSTSRYVVAYRTSFVERTPLIDDRVDIGIVDTDDAGCWTTIGESRAWSWQQGPMAQWIPGRQEVIWNDRENGRFVARVHDVASGHTRTLPRPVYAVDPEAGFGLSLNMARLDALRPGYGYVGGRGAQLRRRRSRSDGVWRCDLASGDTRLILTLDRAVRFLYTQLGWRGYIRHLRARYSYWFNHVKLSPDGQRFTVKLRFRRRGPNGQWNDRMGVSLTCGVDGRDLRLLTDATSHVIWLDNEHLYLWRIDGFYLYRDQAPRGERVRQIAAGTLGKNAHVRYFPDSAERFVFDTPYQQTIDLLTYDESEGVSSRIAQFGNHRPEAGPYRCDLHPCPSPDGHKILVTSLQDGGRQLYLLRNDAAA